MKGQRHAKALCIVCKGSICYLEPPETSIRKHYLSCHSELAVWERGSVRFDLKGIEKWPTGNGRLKPQSS